MQDSRWPMSKTVTFGCILIALSCMSATAQKQSPTDGKRKTPAERLRDQVDAIEGSLYAYEKCSKEGEVCGGTREEKAKVSELVRKLLIERLSVSTNPGELVEIADLADCCHILCADEQCYKEKDTLRINAIKKALRVAPNNPAAHMAFAMALWGRAQKGIRDEETQNLDQWRFEHRDASEQPSNTLFDEVRSKYTSLFAEAERHAKVAMELTPKPSWEFCSNFADIEDDVGKHQAAYTWYQRALIVARGQHGVYQDVFHTEEKITLERLWPEAFNLGKIDEGKKHHYELAQLGDLKDGDWFIYALRLVDTKDYSGAAEAYDKAAELSVTDSVKAQRYALAASYFYFAGRTDEALAAGRSALQLADAVDASSKADAARVLSDILASRGVGDEALRYAEQAVAAQPDDHRTHFSRGNALYGLRRYQEAVAALKEALRLSDGKYGYEHFLLGNVYFNTGAWSDAADEFKHAAEIDRRDSAATYNLALCYQNMGYSGDAADWFQETLKRDPQHPNREQILKAIARLRGK